MDAVEHPLYPAFLKLGGRSCLVVGAGTVACGKITALLESGAKVTVVAPEVSEGVGALAEKGQITLLHRAYQAGEAAAYFLIIAATSSQEVNRQVYEDGERAQRPVNVVDVPELCGFFAPAVVRRGLLQVAVSTSGSAPRLARRIRQQLDSTLSPGWEGLLNEFQAFRLRLKTRYNDPRQRMTQNLSLCDSPAIDAYLAGNPEPLRKAMASILEEP